MSRNAILDLPVPLEPIIVDLDIPLEDQLPPGIYLEAARKMLAEYPEPITIANPDGFR